MLLIGEWRGALDSRSLRAFRLQTEGHSYKSAPTNLAEYTQLSGPSGRLNHGTYGVILDGQLKGESTLNKKMVAVILFQAM